MLKLKFLPRVVLFDLDGTLIDTIPDLAEAIQRMLAEMRQPARSLQELTGFIGKGVGHLVQSALTVNRSPKTEAEYAQGLAIFRRHYTQLNGVKSIIYPGVIETLTWLRTRNIGLGCVTNKSAEFTLPLLQQLDLAKFFGAVISGDSLPQKKPNPEPLWIACEKLGVPRQEASTAALMIGDSVNDALAARNANIPVWLMTYGYSEGIPLTGIDCDGLITSMTELIEKFPG
jgi:phosphoglycolate phosphatase